MTARRTHERRPLRGAVTDGPVKRLHSAHDPRVGLNNLLPRRCASSRLDPCHPAHEPAG